MGKSSKKHRDETSTTSESGGSIESTKLEYLHQRKDDNEIDTMLKSRNPKEKCLDKCNDDDFVHALFRDIDIHNHNKCSIVPELDADNNIHYIQDCDNTNIKSATLSQNNTAIDKQEIYRTYFSNPLLIYDTPTILKEYYNLRTFEQVIEFISDDTRPMSLRYEIISRAWTYYNDQIYFVDPRLAQFINKHGRATLQFTLYNTMYQYIDVVNNKVKFGYTKLTKDKYMKQRMRYLFDKMFIDEDMHKFMILFMQSNLYAVLKKRNNPYDNYIAIFRHVYRLYITRKIKSMIDI